MKRFLLKITNKIVNWLPRRVALSLGSGLGILLYNIVKLTRFKGTLERNVLTAFPNFSEDKAKKIAKKHAKDIGRTLVEIMRFEELPRLLKKRKIKVDGLDILKDALCRENGAVLLSAHMGNWELLISIMGLLGYPVHIIGLEQHNKLANDFLVRQRELFGTKMVYAHQADKEHVKDILQNNGLILLLADQHHYGAEARNIVDFFGKPVSVPAGPIYYSLKFGAPLIPIHTIREESDTHRIVIEQPIPLKNSENLKEVFLDNCRLYMQVYERWIKKDPDQWMWSHERWAWLDENLQPKYTDEEK